MLAQGVHLCATVVCSLQNAIPRLAKDLLWEPLAPGPLPLMPPGPGKALLLVLLSCPSCRCSAPPLRA